jgi:hypothetical protein
LFTSGETREIKDPAAAMLRKPVTREDLAQAVRQAFDDASGDVGSNRRRSC